MVRKRKSLPRDSKGFEPIEAYLREVEEDLNKNSSGERVCVCVRVAVIVEMCPWQRGRVGRRQMWKRRRGRKRRRGS